ncbi:MAG: PAS domain S-box protein [Chitinophagaceae bacterium]
MIDLPNQKEPIVNKLYLLEQTLNNIDDGIVSFDIEMNYTFINEKGAALLGKKKTELIGKNFWKLFPEALHDDFGKHFQIAINTGKPIQFDSLYQPWNRWFENKIYPSHNGVTIYFRDITIQKEKEAKNILANKQISQFFDEVPLGILISCFKNKEIIFVNKWLSSIIGFESNQFIGKSVDFLFGKTCIEKLEHHFSRLKHSENAEISRVQLINHDGQYIPLNITSVNIIFNNNACVCSLFSEITHEQQQNALLTESIELAQKREKILKQVQAIAEVGYWELNHLTGELTWSNDIYNIFEINKEAFKGTYTDFLNIVHPADRELVNTEFTAHITTQKEYDIVHRIITSKQTIKYVHEKCQTNFDKKGRPIFSLGVVKNVTDYKEQENLIAKKEADFNLIANNSDDIFWIRNSDNTQLVYVSPAAEKLFGQKLATIFHDENSFIELIHPEDRKKLLKANKQYLKTGLLNCVFRIVRNIDNEVVWLHAHSKPVYNQLNQITAHIGFASDITELKNYEFELSKMKNLLEEAGKMANMGAFEWNLLSNTLEWSAATKIIHEVGANYKPNLATAISFYHPNDRVLIEKAVANAVEKGEQYDLELRIVTKKKQVKWVRTTGKAVLDNGKCIKLYGTFQDITANRVATDILQREKEKLANIIDATNAGIWEWNVQTGETVFNETWAKIIGYELSELKKTNINLWEELTHPEDLPTAYQKLEAYFKGETDLYECEFRMKHKTGDWVWILDRGKVITKTPDGKPLWMFGTHIDITAKKNFEKQLIESEKKFKIVADNTFNWEFWESPSGKILYHSPSCFAVTGYTKEEFFENAGLLHKVIHPDDLKHFIQHNHIRHLDHKPDKHYFRIITKTGETKFIEHVCLPVFDENKEFLGIRGTNIDITERVQNEEKIRKLSRAVEQSSASIVITDIDGTIEYVNPKFSEITGYSFEEAIGKNPRILKSGYLSQNDYQVLWKTITSGKVWQGEFLNIKKDHSTYWEQATISPIFNDKGTITHFLAVKEDITERKKAAQALIESEERFKNIFLDNASPMYLIDPNTGRFLDINDAALKYYGYTRNEMMALNITEINTSLKGINDKLIKLQAGHNQHFEFKHKLASGEIRDVEVFSSLVSVSGNIVVHEIIHDITERNQFFAAMEAQNEVLQEIAWTQSHIVRAPLSRMMGMIQLLEYYDFSQKEEGDLLKSQKDVLDAIVTAAKELDGIIHDISKKTYLLSKK